MEKSHEIILLENQVRMLKAKLAENEIQLV